MEIFNLTAHEVRDMLRNRDISSRELTEKVLHRIAKTEPYVASYLSITDNTALYWADKVDEMIENGEEISDIAGIPMAIKDNMCTKEITTTCGSKILENFVPPYNATVTERLYKNKAILLGKTNMDEFAMGSSTENSAFKVTKNPWDLERVPGGSSGGSAASVLAGQAFFSLGSDTGGSIRQPASFCGIVGLKPTYGAVSRYGLVAFASSFDQIGPLTKDVEDCALVMNAIAGHDPMDSTSVKKEMKDFKAALVNDVKGLKIGVPKEYFDEGIDENIKKSVYKAIETLKGLGADYEEISLPYSKYALSAYYIIAPSEASSNLARFDGVRYGYRAKNYEGHNDLFTKTRSEAFGDEVKRRIMIGTYSLSSGYYDAYYNRALKVRTLIKEDFEKAFEKYDVIITPTTPTTAFKIGANIDDPLQMYMNDICTVPINMAGVPAISIPCGFDGNNLPIGMQIIGKHFDEETLLRVAYTFEQNTDFNRRPEL